MTVYLSCAPFSVKHNESGPLSRMLKPAEFSEVIDYPRCDAEELALNHDRLYQIELPAAI